MKMRLKLRVVGQDLQGEVEDGEEDKEDDPAVERNLTETIFFPGESVIVCPINFCS